MKVQCHREGLLSAVQLASVAVPARDLKPVLRNLKAIAQTDRCTLLATDLELGIRLINWSLVWQLVGGENSPLFDGESGRKLRADWQGSVHAHCRGIARHLSRHSSANNHLIGELAGLLRALAQLFLSPAIGGGMEQRDQCIRRRYNNPPRKSVLGERRIVLLRGRQEMLPREKENDDLRCLRELVPVRLCAELVHASSYLCRVPAKMFETLHVIRRFMGF